MSLQSENINELMSALAKAQGQMNPAFKDSTNPHFKSKYADLASIWQACREPLATNGLAVTQTMDLAGEKQVLVTTLGHSSGQWMKSLMLLPIQKPGAQEVGSCLSYCRRYSLASICGVYQDDDDGEAAQHSYRDNAKLPKISEEQCAVLDGYLQEFPDAEKGICEKFGVVDVYNLPSQHFNYVVDVFKKRQLKKGEKNV